MVVVVLSAIVLVQITPSAVSSCLKMETENKQTNKIKKRCREKEVGWWMRKAEENKRKHKLEMAKYYKYEPVQ